MNKLCIYITGNIGVGKSTLARNLSLKMGIPVFSIDEYRRNLRAYTLPIEHLAWRSMSVEIDCSDEEVLIVESTGLSSKLVRILEESFSEVFHIHLDAPDEELVKRIRKRAKSGYEMPPFCYNDGDMGDLDRVAKLRELWKLKGNFPPVDLYIDTDGETVNQSYKRVLKQLKFIGIMN